MIYRDLMIGCAPPEAKWEKREIPVLTPEMVAERDRRLWAPRPLTAWICGDPAPGCSELDKRKGI
jgi:hypothetical protein